MNYRPNAKILQHMNIGPIYGSELGKNVGQKSRDTVLYGEHHDFYMINPVGSPRIIYYPIVLYKTCTSKKAARMSK